MSQDWIPTPSGEALHQPLFSLSAHIEAGSLSPEVRLFGGLDYLCVDNDAQGLVIHGAKIVRVVGKAQVQVHGSTDPAAPTLVYLFGQARCTAFGNVKAIVTDQAQLRGYGRVDATYSQQSSGSLFNAGRALVLDQAQVTGYDNSAASVLGQGVYTMFGPGSAWASDMGRVLVHGRGGTAHAHQAARVELSADCAPAQVLMDEGSSLAIPPTMDVSDVQLFLTISESVRLDEDSPVSADELLAVSKTPTRGYQEGGSPAEDVQIAREQGLIEDPPASSAPAPVAPSAPAGAPVIAPPPIPVSAPGPAGPVAPVTPSGAPIPPSGTYPAHTATATAATTADTTSSSHQGQAAATAVPASSADSGDEERQLPPPLSPYDPDLSEPLLDGWNAITGGVPPTPTG